MGKYGKVIGNISRTGIIAILLFIPVLNGNGQESGPLQWHTFWGATDLHWPDEGRAVAAEGGSVYIAGHSYGSWVGATNPDGSPITILRNKVSEGNRDGVVMKASQEGLLEWVTFLGGWHDDESCLDIAVVPAGDFQGIYACGFSGVWSDPYEINDPVSNIIHQHYTSGGQDAFVIRMDLDGNIQWLTFLGGSGQDIANSMTIDDTSGEICITGYSGRPWVDDDYQNEPINPFSEDWQDDAFVAKLDANGNYYWHTFLGGTEGNGKGDYGSGIDFDPAGNIYVGGHSTGTWGTPLGGFYHQGGADDGFIAKLNPGGGLLWHLFMGTSGFFSDQCHDLVVDDLGNVYATGYTWGGWDTGLWGEPVVPYGDNEFEDIFITKITRDGVPVWHTLLGTSGRDIGEDILLDINGSVYITGKGCENWGDPVLPSSSSGDQVFAARLDNGGNLLWNAFLSSWNYSHGYGIAIDDGFAYLTGLSKASFDCLVPALHPHLYEYSMSFYNPSEIYIAKIDPEASVISPALSSLSVIQGETAGLIITVTDPCKKLGSLTVSMGTISDNEDGSWTWSLETSDISVGTYEVVISADDGSGWTPSATINLEILQPNRPPVLTFDNETVVVNVGEPVVNSGTVADPDGDDYHMYCIPVGSLTYGDGIWTLQYEPDLFSGGRHSVTICVYDDNGNEICPFFDVLVKDADSRISSGIEWLAGQQNEDGSWNGLYEDSGDWVNNDAPVTCTAFALIKLCDFAHENGDSPFDPDYPYVGNVIAGFNFLFSQANTDGSGIYIHNDEYPFSPNYSTSTAMAAVKACGLPDMLIDYQANDIVNKLTFKELMSGMTTFIIDQQDDNGSWEVNTQITGYVAYGLHCAEAFGCDVPQIIKGNLSNWIDLIQAESGGAHWYNQDDEYVNMINTAHLLVQMAFCGDDPENPRVQAAINYIANIWNNPDLDAMWQDNYVELLYTIMKAFELFSIETINVGGENINWFEDITDKVFQTAQNYDEGYWICTWYGSRVLNTCWALLTLERNVPQLEVINQLPDITSVSGPAEPVPINSEVTLNIVFIDDNVTDASINWGDGTSSSIAEPSSSFIASHTYATAGVYGVTVKVTDEFYETDQEIYNYVVVYDPSAGFVTGGGWIDSPRGAYVAEPDLTGKANFGFVSRYKKGQTTPDGNTEFQFVAADLNFHSSSYDWLIISGAKAMFKGEGTINNDGWYGFQLSAVDAELTPKTVVDLLRIRIWDKTNNDEIIYDNSVGEDDQNADPSIAIGGGSIKIHNVELKGRTLETVSEISLIDDFEIKVYPNPFKAKTTVCYQIPYSTHVRIRVFDIYGRDVMVLINEDQEEGYYSYELDANNFTNGIYLCEMRTAGFICIKKLIIGK